MNIKKQVIFMDTACGALKHFVFFYQIFFSKVSGLIVTAAIHI